MKSKFEPLTFGQVQKIAKLRRRGYSNSEIARVTKLPQNQIANKLWKMGVKSLHSCNANGGLKVSKLKFNSGSIKEHPKNWGFIPDQARNPGELYAGRTYTDVNLKPAARLRGLPMTHRPTATALA